MAQKRISEFFSAKTLAPKPSRIQLDEEIEDDSVDRGEDSRNPPEPPPPPVGATVEIEEDSDDCCVMMPSEDNQAACSSTTNRGGDDPPAPAAAGVKRRRKGSPTPAQREAQKEVTSSGQAGPADPLSVAGIDQPSQPDMRFPGRKFGTETFERSFQKGWFTKWKLCAA